MNKQYNLPLTLTKKVYNKLVDELQVYCRMIPEKNTPLYIYDITFDKPMEGSNLLSINAESAFVERKKYALLLNDVKLSLDNILRTDHEITHLRAVNSKIFVKYYQLSFKKYLNNKINDAAELIEEALKHRPKDNLCFRLKYYIEKANIN